MRRIYAIGESLVDIIFRNNQPQAAKAGGAMLNTTVSLGRIGLPVSLVTEYAGDDVGNLINTFLEENGVDTGSVFRFDNGKTALALAFLDERNDAHYTFYKNYPPNRLEIATPSISGDDFLLYGSIYSVTREIRPNFMKLVNGARQNGAFIIYDPNFRKAHASELAEHKPMIMENLKDVTVMRGSDEDFMNIFGANDEDAAWSMVKDFCRSLVYTASSEKVAVRTHFFSGEFPVRKINPVSTIGAGDNFNAGLIASFYAAGIVPDDIKTLGKESWQKIISTAVDFASNVCMSYDNYIDLEFARRYRSASRSQI
ncbi:MAG TPA: PfkB family carbohydrate kinase [Bacteroidales bacterium]|nr:PfkB family carbohydrate kinase [Bacteroidales bacterium]